MKSLVPRQRLELSQPVFRLTVWDGSRAGSCQPTLRCYKGRGSTLCASADSASGEASIPSAPSTVPSVTPGSISAQPLAGSAPVSPEPSAAVPASDAPTGVQHSMLQSAAVMRQLTGCETATDCMAKFLELAEQEDQLGVLKEEDCIAVIGAAIDRGNFELAKDVYNTMGRSTAAMPGALDAGRSSVDGSTWVFPPATIQSTQAMVMLLARELRVGDALDVVARIRSRGLPSADEVPFGVVVSSPLAPDKALTVVQPQEGSKVVACAESRYEFEVFSGTVLGAPKSEAQNAADGLLKRFFGFGKGACQAVHEVVVRAPDGISRTFRFGTTTADVPAQEGERVSVIACPEASQSLRKQGLLTSRPPGTKPGEPLEVVNHELGTRTLLVRPTSKAAAALPPWLPYAAGAFLLADFGSGFVDANLPTLIAGGAAAAGASFVGGNQFLIPRLKQLPEKSVAVEEVQQGLLQQYATLTDKARKLSIATKDGIRSLARLWQLQVKMQSVGGSYDARLGRVISARGLLEGQVQQQLVLLEGYSRIASMIEIEVEMNTSVPQSEIDDIESQIRDLAEVEEMQQEWELQAEAQDELETLLRVS
eukprot:jgi/Ulvmu1/10989/UM007_0169.1